MKNRFIAMLQVDSKHFEFKCFISITNDKKDKKTTDHFAIELLTNNLLNNLNFLKIIGQLTIELKSELILTDLNHLN